ncbi:MAG TPA: hypothetical protein VMV47_06350 [Bacteroidales bacterium]|nr:hypothetical protein [Bacteroidales bacterium]
MSHFLKIASSLLLLFNGTGAFYGGIGLITDPSGYSIKLSMNLLEHTPFNNYLIPGIVLLCVNGVFSYVSIGMILVNNIKAYLFIILQGILLSGWLIIQVILIRTFYPPMHITLFLTGFLLIMLGILYRRNQKT